MKLCRFFVFLVVLLTFSQAGTAKAEWSIWDFLFPMEKDEQHRPTQDGRAPFADKDAILEGKSIEERMAGNNSPLHVRHRLNADIAKWVESEISDVLTYKADTYKQEYEKKAKSFDKKGLEEYVKFLQDNKIVSGLKSGAYDVRTFVKDVPVLLNEGAIADRYRWLYRTKVMVSFIPVEMDGYTPKGGTGGIINQEMMVDIHLGRVEQAKNEHGVMIEGWSSSGEDKDDDE